MPRNRIGIINAQLPCTSARDGQRRLAWEIRAASGLSLRPTEPFDRAHVRIERHAVQSPDIENAIGGAKFLIGCPLTPGTPRLVRGKLVVPHPTGLGFIRDDREDCMVLDLVRVRVPTRAEQKTVVEITELLEAP